MRTVAADPVFLCVLVFDGIGACLFGHGLMERGVENKDLRNIRHDLGAAFNAHKMSRSVKRCKVVAETELLNDLRSDKTALKEVRTAMDHTMSDSLYLAHIFYAAENRVGKGIDNDLHCDGVIGHCDIALVLLPVLAEAVLNAPVDPDTLADAFCKNVSALGVEELIFKRRAAGVDNKYFH